MITISASATGNWPGFALVGTERQVGQKFNRWLDVVVMQRML